MNSASKEGRRGIVALPGVHEIIAEVRYRTLRTMVLSFISESRLDLLQNYLTLAGRFARPQRGLTPEQLSRLQASRSQTSSLHPRMLRRASLRMSSRPSAHNSLHSFSFALKTRPLSPWS